jgi:hypothetical protein
MPLNALDVFINCPFDVGYKPIFNAIVFTVIRSGYRVRCALETDDTSDNRFAKICAIIGECKFGVHDISRTETDGDPPLPRFNMPLELGVFLGAKRFGTGGQKGKACIVFDREPYRFQRFISDIAGQDIRTHGGDVPTLIRELAAWLRTQPGGLQAGGGQAIAAEYADFEAALPAICTGLRLQIDELEFGDVNAIMTAYVERLTTGPAA